MADDRDDEHREERRPPRRGAAPRGAGAARADGAPRTRGGGTEASGSARPTRSAGQRGPLGTGRPAGGAGGAADRGGAGPRAEGERGAPRAPRPGGARAGRGAGAVGRPVERRTTDDRPRVVAPELPDDVEPSDLDRAARSRLRTLGRENAEGVARHLVMAGRLLDDDPELAYQHAQAAVRRAGRVDVVREAAGLTAYRTGRYAEALRELRTVRRLNGSDEHLALLADCERGLGRPERALALVRDDAARTLPEESRVELAIVESGARLDLGEPEAALAALGTPVVLGARGELADRVAQARASALRALGRGAEADALEAGLARDDVDVVVFDLEEEDAAAEPEVAPEANAPVRAAHEDEEDAT